MLFNYLILSLIIAEHHSVVTNIISISAIVGRELLFNDEILENDENSKPIVWYKGITNLKLLINSYGLSVNLPSSSQSRYYLVNRTKLLIKQTLIGDEGFYTLKIQTKSYIFHVNFNLTQTTHTLNFSFR